MIRTRTVMIKAMTTRKIVKKINKIEANSGGQKIIHYNILVPLFSIFTGRVAVVTYEENELTTHMRSIDTSNKVRVVHSKEEEERHGG